MDVNKHIERFNRNMNYIKTRTVSLHAIRGVNRVVDYSINTKKQFPALITKARNVTKKVGTKTFFSLLAGVGYAIANAAYTTIVGYLGEYVQAVAHVTIDAWYWNKIFVCKLRRSLCSFINKAQKLLTRKDIPFIVNYCNDQRFISLAAELSAIRKDKVDNFCERFVRYFMARRGTFFFLSSLAIVLFVINTTTAFLGVVFPAIAPVILIGAGIGCVIAGGYLMYTSNRATAAAGIGCAEDTRTIAALEIKVSKLEEELAMLEIKYGDLLSQSDTIVSICENYEKVFTKYGVPWNKGSQDHKRKQKKDSLA